MTQNSKILDENNVALDEYVYKMCEEILSKDTAYQELNNAILDIESRFKSSLTSEQIKEYNKIEEKNIEAMTRAAYCIYQNCFSAVIKSVFKG